VVLGLLIALVVAVGLYMQSSVQSYHQTKRSERASVADVKAESQKIDTVWHSLSPVSSLGYSPASKECIKVVDGQEQGTCLPNSVFAKLHVTSSVPALATADTIATQLEQAGWQKRYYVVKSSGAEKSRETISELPAQFQNLRLSYQSPERGTTRRCLGLIYSSKNAQMPGWSGNLGKCS